jgi:hypothetical protein
MTVPFRRNLYEIPITQAAFPSRNHMPSMAGIRSTGPMPVPQRWQHFRAISGTCALVYAADSRRREHPVLDIMMLVITAAFFAASVGYVYVCEQL